MNAPTRMTLRNRLASLARGLRTAWLVLGAIVLCFALVEVGARLALRLLPSPDRGFDETNSDVLRDADWRSGYLAERDASSAAEWHSYVYWRRRPFAGSYINIDEQGRRRTWNVDLASRDPIRVFLFGGSTLWGRGARDDFTIPSQLSRALAETEDLPAELTNFGESGYVNTQELIGLMLELRNGNVPDVVVFYDGVNEVFAAYQSGGAGLPQNEHKRRLDFEAFEMAFALRVADRLSSVTLARRLLGSEAAVAGTRGEIADGGLARRIVETYKGNLRVIDSLADAFGFQVRYFWQPMVLSRRSPTPHETAVASHLARESPDLHLLYRQTYELIAADPDLRADPRFHDLQDALGTEEPSLYIDFAHVTEAGNGRIARAMLPALIEVLPAH